MPINQAAYFEIKNELAPKHISLVAVSKTQSIDAILELYNLGHRDFGENYVQELVEKHQQLPNDIRWHFIGHLQSNKIKKIISFVHLIQSVDSTNLLQQINKEALKCNRVVDCLLQIHIAQEETKFGMDAEELSVAVKSKFENVTIRGLMGMASFTEDSTQIRKEFSFINSLYKQYNRLSILSIGMSADYKIAISEGSTSVRIGSLLFGKRS